MNKELAVLCHHLEDLIDKSYMQERPFYSDFLSLEESGELIEHLRKHTEVSLKLDGGYDHAERQIMIITPVDSHVDICPPIDCIRIEPLQFRFHDELTHRDYLGALMHLGIERSLLGDIVIHQETRKGHTYPVACVFCVKRISDFILQELLQIKHTHIRCSREMDYRSQHLPKLETLEGTVASNRIDAVAAWLTHLSRTQINTLIREKKVFINNICIQTTSYLLKENDILRIRGYGKYIFQGNGNRTKKGRLVVYVQKYI